MSAFFINSTHLFLVGWVFVCMLTLWVIWIKISWKRIVERGGESHATLRVLNKRKTPCKIQDVV